jgi:hypothetical protein
MEELHSRWASPPQAALCAAVNAAAGSGAKDAIRASPKKAAKVIVARFSDISVSSFLQLEHRNSRTHRLEKHYALDTLAKRISLRAVETFGRTLVASGAIAGLPSNGCLGPGCCRAPRSAISRSCPILQSRCRAFSAFRYGLIISGVPTRFAKLRRRRTR